MNHRTARPSLTCRAAVGLSGAAMLAAGSRAYAVELIPPPPDIPPVAPGGSSAVVPWDADGDAQPDFACSFQYPNTSTLHWRASMNPLGGSAAGNAVAGWAGTFQNLATNFTLNREIGPNIPAAGAPSWRTSPQVALGSVYGPGSGFAYGGFGTGAPPGPFQPDPNPGGGQPPASAGYAGFRISTGATARYGWVLLQTGPQHGINFTNAAIGSPGETVITFFPEPTSLAFLAAGAAALLRLRRSGQIRPPPPAPGAAE